MACAASARVWKTVRQTSPDLMVFAACLPGFAYALLGDSAAFLNDAAATDG